MSELISKEAREILNEVVENNVLHSSAFPIISEVSKWSSYVGRTVEEIAKQTAWSEFESYLQGRYPLVKNLSGILFEIETYEGITTALGYSQGRLTVKLFYNPLPDLSEGKLAIFLDGGVVQEIFVRRGLDIRPEDVSVYDADEDRNYDDVGYLYDTHPDWVSLDREQGD